MQSVKICKSLISNDIAFIDSASFEPNVRHNGSGLISEATQTSMTIFQMFC